MSEFERDPRTALAYLVSMAQGHDYADERKISDAEDEVLFALDDQEQREAAVRAEVIEGMATEERWVPVTESGDRWAGRSRDRAEGVMAQWPAGGRFASGDRYDGVTHLEREIRVAGGWIVAPPTYPAHRHDRETTAEEAEK